VPRTLALVSPSPAVVLPSYNGARKLPNFTPLLALLLAREGVPVLVHGFEEDPTRVTSAQVFATLGLPAVTTAADAQARWAQGQPVFMPLDVLHPSLADLLRLRQVLGLRNTGHTLAKLLPAVPGAVRVVNHTHPEYALSLAEFLNLNGATALLLRGTEGEPVADARRRPAFKCFVQGLLSDALSVEAQGGSLTDVPDLPAGFDAATTAQTIQAMLAGQISVPAPIDRQLRCLLDLRRATAA
jgi:anthranilate phosphoribosyltransferase